MTKNFVADLTPPTWGVGHPRIKICETYPIPMLFWQRRVVLPLWLMPLSGLHASSGWWFDYL